MPAPTLLSITLLLLAPVGEGRDEPAFVDVAAERGLEWPHPSRTQLIDIDGDGWLDVVIPGSPFRILRSTAGEDGRRVFVDATAGTGLDDREHSLLLWGDVNGDGHLDAISIVTQNAQQHAENPQTHAVYLGDGRGRFARQAETGLEQERHTATMSGILADLDLDGRLDVAFANQYDGEGLLAQPMRVFRGDGTGRFEDVTEAWGFPTHTVAPGAAHAPRPLYGLTAADLDNDGYPELLGAAYGRQWNTLWKRNPIPDRPHYDDLAANYALDADAIRHGRYSEAVKAAHRARGIERRDELPFRTGGNTFALAAADFDNDGDLDLFSAEITHAWAGDSSDFSMLLVNRLETLGVPFFERQREFLDEPDPQTGRRDRPGRGLVRDLAPQTPANWNQGDLQAHWADFDNDGLLDLLICESDYPHNRLRLFMQNADHSFTERSLELGLDWPNAPGAAIGDFDNDGDIDILATGSVTRWPEARPEPALALWENRLAPPENGWLVIQLIGDGETANTSAIGARVTLRTSDGRMQMREASGPYGHAASQTHPGLVHFGLGEAEAEELIITWPDEARTQTKIDNPGRNVRMTVRQEEGPARPLSLRERVAPKEPGEGGPRQRLAAAATGAGSSFFSPR